MLDTDVKNGSQEIKIETIKSSFSLRDKQLRSFDSERARKHNFVYTICYFISHG